MIQQDYFKYLKKDLIGSFLKKYHYRKKGNIFYHQANENYFHIIT